MTKQEILKKMGTLGDVTKGYFPTEEEIEEETVDTDIPYLILFMSTDPFTRLDHKKKDDPEYKNTVKYTKAYADDLSEEEFY